MVDTCVQYVFENQLVFKIMTKGKETMRRFKLVQGNEKPYEITKRNFEELTGEKEPYVTTGADGQTRYFGICPACDNPIQLIGLYKKLKNTDVPYGKHYNRDADIALHNEQAYSFCPYASHIYSGAEKQRKDELTDFEKNIYYTVRDYFDYAVYLLKEVTGLKISEKSAEQILREYLAGDGYMYYGATYYNIPWMLMYFGIAKPVYGRLVRAGSPLYEMLKDHKDVLLEQYRDSTYYRVNKAGKWLDLQYSVILHKRKVVNDEVREEIRLSLFSQDKNNLPMKEAERILDINEYRFPNLIHSEKAANYRNEKLLQIAERLMPDLDGDG